MRAAQRTFEGAYTRTALGQFSFALVVLKIFSHEFYPIGAVFAVFGCLVMGAAALRRSSGNRQFFEMGEGRRFRTSGNVGAFFFFWNERGRVVVLTDRVGRDVGYVHHCGSVFGAVVVDPEALRSVDGDRHGASAAARPPRYTFRFYSARGRDGPRPGPVFFTSWPLGPKDRVFLVWFQGFSTSRVGRYLYHHHSVNNHPARANSMQRMCWEFAVVSIARY